MPMANDFSIATINTLPTNKILENETEKTKRKNTKKLLTFYLNYDTFTFCLAAKYPVFSIRGGFISIDTSCLQGRIVIR
jgi:hypothetical protein